MLVKLVLMILAEGCLTLFFIWVLDTAYAANDNKRGTLSNIVWLIIFASMLYLLAGCSDSFIHNGVLPNAQNTYYFFSSPFRVQDVSGVVYFNT